jgi:hypothetical protein
MRRALTVAVVAVFLASAAPAAAASPSWERSFGADTGGPGVDICTVAANCVPPTGSQTDGGGFETVDDTAIDGDGDVYVTDGFYHRVTKFDADGNFMRAWGVNVDKAHPGQFGICTVATQCDQGLPANEGGGMTAPEGIAVGPAGEVYVVEADGDRVSVFDSDGHWRRSFGQGVATGAAAFETCTVAASCRSGYPSGIGGSFDTPSGIAFDSQGNFWVSERGDPRIQKFDSADGFVMAVGKDVGGAGIKRCLSGPGCQAASYSSSGHGREWSTVEGVGTEFADRVLVADHGNESITVLDSDGNFLWEFGSGVAGGSGPQLCGSENACTPGAQGSGAGEFNYPTGVTGDHLGNVYVSEGGDSRVQILSETGGFKYALGKDVDDRHPGVFAVCDSAAHCRAGASGAKGGEITQALNLEVSPVGYLYVADSGGGRVSKFYNPIAPPAPSALGVSPTGPSSENDITVHGIAAGGTTAQVYAGVGCVGSPIASGSAAEFRQGLPVHVDNDTTSQFTARVEINGIQSDCTAAVTYVQDSTLIDTVIEDGPRGPTSNRTPGISFRADPPDDVTFECTVDARPYVACGPTTWSPPDPVTADGDHTFSVRATRHGHTDPTPATWTWKLDTVAPAAQVDVTGSSVAAGYAGPALVRASGTDPEPASGIGQVRCVVDPPAVPTSYNDLPAGECSVSVTATGSHTVYAAADDRASNEGPVVRRTFTILPIPDTYITSGPTGSTWQSDPSFTFSASLPSSFRCHIDFTIPADCSSPYTTAPLRAGEHTFTVAAVADGVEDPVPATRTFVVKQSVTQTKSPCEVSPFTAPAGSSTVGCGWGTCPARVNCSDPIPPCPVTAVCSLTVKMTFDTPLDRFTSYPLRSLGPGQSQQPIDYSVDGAWEGNATLGFLGALRNCEVSDHAVHPVVGSGRPDGRTHCDAAPGATFFGQNRTINTYCYMFAYTNWSGGYDTSGNPYQQRLRPKAGDTGPDDQRRLTCEVEQVVKAASALETAVAGENVDLYTKVPGHIHFIGQYFPGDTTPAGTTRASRSRTRRAFRTPAYMASVSRRRTRQAFKATTVNVKKAGPVRLKFKLTAGASRQLKATGRLRLRLPVTFTPGEGKATKKTITVTLTRPVDPVAVARQYCRKHRKNKRCHHGRRI